MYHARWINYLKLEPRLAHLVNLRKMHPYFESLIFRFLGRPTSQKLTNLHPMYHARWINYLKLDIWLI
jgi:hypothetical protein